MILKQPENVTKTNTEIDSIANDVSFQPIVSTEQRI